MTLPLIEAWHRRLLEEPLPLGPSPGLVMGAPLWGEYYIDCFLKFCLPSMLVPRNRAALEAANWAMVLFVDEHARARLVKDPLAAGLPLHLLPLPQPIIDSLPSDGHLKYPLLTAIHNALIHKARDAGRGFHFLCLDTAFSNRYFESLLRLAARHDAVVDSALVLDVASGLPALGRFSRNGLLDISARELSFLGYTRMATAWRGWNLDGLVDFEEMPNSAFIHVRSRDSVRIYCPHKNAAWMSNARCQKVEAGLGGTIDSEMPRYIAGNFYTPTIDDEMCQVSFSGGSETAARCNWDDFKREFWLYIGGKDDKPRENRFLPYFTAPNVFPLPEDSEAPEDAELDARFERLMEKLYG